MIFISHTHSDKPVVEPVALRLREIFGEANVFYDSWSIRPGDGIIDKMNQGLRSPSFVFFFVSEASLKSKMVDLEWQNALFRSTKGGCKIIPVRVDGCAMPPILLQNLYIDMFSSGIETTIVQIVNIVQGNNSFTPQHLGFSNLTYRVAGDPKTEIVITIAASHLMEPNPEFAILVKNKQEDVHANLLSGGPHMGGFNSDVRLDNGIVVNAIGIVPLGGAITPKRPMGVVLKAQNGQSIELLGIMHRKTNDRYEGIPQAA